MAPKKDPKKRPRKPQFEVGERVLCFEGPLLYEAECVKVSVKYRKVKYLVHYPGGNEKGAVRTRLSEKLAKMEEAVAAPCPVGDGDTDYKEDYCPTAGWDDEWVPESRILKYSETNLQKQRELLNSNEELSADEKVGEDLAPGEKKSSGRKTPTSEPKTPSSESKTATSESESESQQSEGQQEKNLDKEEASTASGPSGSSAKKKEKKMAETGEGSSSSETSTPSRPQHSKRRARVYYEVERRYVKKTDIKVNIPNELKPWLVEDWELVVGQKQLFHLPAQKNIDSILDDYEEYERAQGNLAKSYSVTEVVAGIKAYFNVMLGPQLLYDFERPQYADILADDPDAPMSQIYGASHLLRLFVKIGDMLSYTALDEQSVALLLNYLHDFLKYLANHAGALFSASDYEVAPPEYLQKVA
ncbi:LOW QUALITY PROTEIN: mortality factor 4-like protein 1 [Dromiciops gliroides]|uniref:LOW QUALITY PROTEIN: mortality factor 4-like protein 1 n=1 Tax=Dromiciops gliroides TaxID=33562 RepID=UPI001CC76643|nr:LOW QUALITY PROTEIN: mortality factor 4-like protein 1 [Dromiciops gliroides]